MSSAEVLAWIGALPWGKAATVVTTTTAGLLWERWLGRTTSTPAASTLDLLVHLWQYRRWGPPVPAPVPATQGSGAPPPEVVARIEKGNPMVSSNPHARSVSVDVDGPTADVMKAITDVVDQLASGVKPQALIGAEIGVVMQLSGEVGDIPADARADPETVERAIALGMVEIGKILRAKVFAAKLGAPPSPK